VPLKALLDIAARREEVLADLSSEVTIQGWLMVVLTELSDAARQDTERQIEENPQKRHQLALEMRRSLARAGAALWEAIDRLEHQDGAAPPTDDLWRALDQFSVSPASKVRILEAAGLGPEPTWPDVDRRRRDRDRRAPEPAA
jgi:hypothetical protein